jgi:hypothetical protein
MAWWGDIIAFFKRWFILKESVVIDPNKQYLWILQNATYDESHDFARKLSIARREHTDIVVPDRFRIIPASSIQMTMEHSGIKSRTQALRIIKEALGTEKDFRHISEILITGEGSIKITKYWTEEDGQKTKQKGRKPGRNH